MGTTLFLEPKFNPVAAAIAKLTLPVVLRFESLKIVPSATVVTTLRKTRNEHVVLMLNHSDRCDPIVAFALSQIANQNLYYLAARELFDQTFGLRGWFLQRCGAYSVMRGFPEDLASKEKTIQIIAERNSKLVMFPEGDVTGRDGDISPLKLDGISNIFQAQARAANAVSSSGTLLEPEPVYILPVSMFYEVTPESVEDIDRCLQRLEGNLISSQVRALHYHKPGPASRSSIVTKSSEKQLEILEIRTRRLLERFVLHIESYYGTSTVDSSISKRLLRVVRQAAIQLGELTGLKNLNDFQNDSAEGTATLLYSVRANIRRRHLAFCSETACRYCLRLGRNSEHRVRASVRELDRLQQLLILATTLDASVLTREHLWRTVDRLEQLITGRATSKGARTVWIETGNPISVLDWFHEYEQDPDGTVRAFAIHVRSRMEHTLRQMNKYQQRITRVS